jgi:RimJ/RimL family protein N-acetyltransferase
LTGAEWDLAPRLAGDIAVLEPLRPEHYGGLLAASRAPEIWRWWPVDPGTDEAAFRGFFDRALSGALDGTASHFATLDARTGVTLGSTSFCTTRPSDRGLEIGWTWLKPTAWGTGANIEVKLMQLRYAFEKLRCIRVEFETDEENKRSRAALEALPAQFEGIHRSFHILPGGRRRNSAFYSILDDEWPAVRSRLTARLAGHLARRR